MNCIPPWLSPTNQCDSNITVFLNIQISNYIDANFSKHFFEPQDSFKSTVAEESCQDPCKIMRNTVSFIGSKESLDLETKFILRFAKNVRIEKKVLSYTLFDFVIDAGSSMGLWLGLSALSAADLVVDTFDTLKRMILNTNT